MRIYISDIAIKISFKQSEPSIKKILRKLNYYKKHKCFDKPIIIDKDGVLQDGYINYLLCKLLSIKSIDVIVQEIQ